MPRNGSGGYSAPTNSWNPATTGNSATPTDFNALLSDIATAISQSIAADGQTPITANIPMGNNKLTGLAQGVAAGDSLAWEQLFSQGVETDVASAATCDIGVVNSAFVRVTGTTTITSFGTNYRGPRFIRFDGALQLTHNASSLILPGGANITTAAGDCAIVRPVGATASGWVVISYQKASGIVTLGANTFTEPQTLPGNASSPLHAVPKQQLDAATAVRFQYSLTSSIPTTSGTSVEFTSIPSWARRISLLYRGVSTNGTSYVSTQFGTSSGYKTTGYDGCFVAPIQGAATVGAQTSTAFALTANQDANEARHGVLMMHHVGGNLWIMTNTGSASGSAFANATLAAGSVQMSGTLEKIKIFTLNGTDTFDAGSVILLIEG